MNVWQDYAITAIQFAFAGALLPAIFGTKKPDRWTCALTASLLYALAVIFLTLDLWLSTASSALVAAAWTVLLVQRRPEGARG